MNFIKSSNSFLKRNNYMNNILSLKIHLVFVNRSRYSSLNEKEKQFEDTKTSDKMKIQKEKKNDEHSQNNFKSYIEYIKKRGYYAKLEDGPNKMNIIQKIYLCTR